MSPPPSPMKESVPDMPLCSCLACVRIAEMRWRMHRKRMECYTQESLQPRADYTVAV